MAASEAPASPITALSGTINNSGRILLGDDAVGIVVLGDSNTITNSGTITVGAGFAVGIDVTSFGGSNSVVNTGTINVGAGGFGVGIMLAAAAARFSTRARSMPRQVLRRSNSAAAAAC